MPVDSAIRDHQSWLGYLQPDGLVVSAAALVDSQVVLDRASATLQPRFLEFIEDIPLGEKPASAIVAFENFLLGFLEWPADCLFGFSPDRPIPESLKIPLLEFGETLEPTAAFRLPQPEAPDHPWLLLVQQLEPGTDLDKPIESKLTGWSASPSRRFERLLREAEVPIGLLSNSTHLRLIYAPRGENAGTLTFPVAAMTEIAGRPILAAFQMLFKVSRLLAGPTNARLPALLKRSREYQARVSTALAEQVLDALYELLRGFQAANDHTHGELLRQVLADDPDQVYAGLLTVLMRLVFLLYAEDRGLMPGSDLYVRNYALHGLFERLRADVHQYPDTMTSRYGAWAQLLALFRAVHLGCTFPLMQMPGREGHLFDPDRYQFLEGRSSSPSPRAGEGQGKGANSHGRPTSRLPLVSDGTIFQILEKLLMLDGERLSYRTLDVEQIGSVYQTMMGFRLERAAGASIALKPGKVRGAPVPLNLDDLVDCPPAKRAKFIQERTDYKLTASAGVAVSVAESVEDFLAALENRVARNATPQLVAAGTMLLVPTDERRKTGSHYTPRSLTEPIVRTTLEPVLKQLGERPTPDQILNLKVCDPAMGSAAFLVEVCRQLADELVKAWAAHGYKPYIPPDEDEILHARRLIAQRCLYGVDRNPLAVDLAKLSLWLATLAKDHPFTFLDHSLRAGDALVGLTRKQISGFHWQPDKQKEIEQAIIETRIARATEFRRRILDARDEVLYSHLQQQLTIADESLSFVRLVGDLVVSAFFSADKNKARLERCDELFVQFSTWISRGMRADERGPLDRAVALLRDGPQSITPFHWEIEFPEVFSREIHGFDSIVGNPPFLGGPQLSELFGGPIYQEWLKECNEGAFGNADLSAYFLRRAFAMIGESGTFGLLATNSISEGGTRTSGLQSILSAGGTIYNATRSLGWPGEAAVFVAVIHVASGRNVCTGQYELDGKHVEFINSRLRPSPETPDPVELESNSLLAFMGTGLGSSGFILDSHEYSTLATQGNNSECLMPYLGGEEVNRVPDQSNERFAINFGSRSLEEAAQYPGLLEIVRNRVKPERDRAKDHGPGKHGKKYWWQFTLRADPLYNTINGLPRCLVAAINTSHLCFSFQPIRQVFAHTLAVFAFDKHAGFACLQSQIHFVWAQLLSSSLKDDLRYSVSDAFQSFPFPEGFLVQQALEIVGTEYYEWRAGLMIRGNEGLTKTYNRFHDPSETSEAIQGLRELHTAMDRAVLEAYGWHDLAEQATCKFLLDYEDDEEEDDGSSEAPRSRRRKPYRYRWPDEFRDEVLARLLDLNQQRAAEERRTGAAAAKGSAKNKKKSPGNKGGKRKSAKAADPSQIDLPGV